MKEINYALRDEKLNIFAMTYGLVSNSSSKQIIICKKSRFADDNLGPYLLDPKTSKVTYTASIIGTQYEQQISEIQYQFRYIAFIKTKTLTS